MMKHEGMSTRTANIVSALLALALAAGIFLVMTFFSRVSHEPPEQVIVRKIDVGLPPPPPPPPPEPRHVPEAMDPTVSINLAGDHGGPAVAFSARPKLANVTIDKMPDKLDDYAMDINADLTRGVRSFKVEQLDEIPTIVSSRRSRIPRELRRQGIRSVEAQVDIIIDTRGAAHIRRIVDAGYPEMVPVITEHVDAIEFTIPKKDGQPVNGEYLFTIRFKEFM